MKTIGNSASFRDFYNEDRIYVDKTETIYNLLKTQDKVFISRPRRFGKSLTLDTIGTLFEKGVEPYFKDTWIYDKWTEPTYPVLRLDFLSYSVTDPDEFKSDLIDEITKFAKNNNAVGYEVNKNPYRALSSLLDAFSEQNKNIVILIDEYDCQLTANINNPKLYEKFREIIRSLYAIIKVKRAIKFLAVTGVTRLKDTTIFSVGSDIDDISNDNAYSQLIGFTRDEIKKFYIDYLKLAASYENKVSVDNVTDAQIEDMLDKLAYNYDGYCFDENGVKKVFSTWSVNNFCQSIVENKKVQFGDYWYDNGGIPSILANYLKSHELNAADYLDKNKVVTVPIELYSNPTSLLDIDQNVLMCQTGYLTLRSVLSSGESEVDLGVPNQEIYKALTKLLSVKFFNGKVSIRNQKRENILDTGSTQDVIELFNRAVNTVSYDRYPITSESSVQSLIQLYLLGAGVNVVVEEHSAKGRADLVIERQNRRIVIELKYAENDSDAKTKLNEAVEQIKTRDYGNILPQKELIRIAAVFNADPAVRAISRYQVV
ncbi:MAG: AAA family ATPase [Succinivibrio sp.]